MTFNKYDEMPVDFGPSMTGKLRKGEILGNKVRLVKCCSTSIFFNTMQLRKFRKASNFYRYFLQ